VSAFEIIEDDDIVSGVAKHFSGYASNISGSAGD
jgi:hypothetical protein